jgi:hypothetical protein
MKTTTIRDRKFFIANKDYLCNIGADFNYISSGSVNRIIYGDREFIYVDVTTSGGRGHHLTKQFIKDIDSYIAKNEGNIPRWDNNYREQMFNIDAIEKNLNKQLVMIDINDCYWRTAYLLGYITEQTYIKGRKRKEWKIGRNACIGGLCKTVVTQGYTLGKVDATKRVVTRPPVNYQFIRNHIIGHVFTMFNELFEQMGNTFFMFLTDCLVTTYENKKRVEDYFTQKGYKVKNKPIEFTNVDRANKKIMWYDFTGTKKDDNGRVLETGVDRYYMYSNAQIVRSLNVSTADYFTIKTPTP